MELLKEILSSKVRTAVFRELFGLNGDEIHVRELARKTSFHEASLRQEMQKLAGLELVCHRKSGNRVYYRANRDHPLFTDIHSLVVKTVGLADVLAAALKGAQIDVAFVFGSVAQARVVAASDVDLMVIGSIGLRELASLISGLTETIGREINPHVLTEEEYQMRLQTGDHFATNVLRGPKIYIVGSEDELEEMGRKYMAEI